MKWGWGLALVFAAVLAGQRGRQHAAARDWPQFGFDAASSGSSEAVAGITAVNVARLTRRQVILSGTVDSSAIYLHAAMVNGTEHDAFFVTTSYGKTIAVDAAAGAVLWEYTPPGYAGWFGTAQITNSTPAADPDRTSIYAASPDRMVQKLAIADGHAVWRTAVTLLPAREKIASALKVFRGRVVAVTGGYIGDANPYQGHVAILDAATGALAHVWNSLCSDRTGLIAPSSCGSSRSAIWGRGGAVIDPATGHIFVATGNGPYDGARNWGDAVVELDADATRVVASYAPENYAALDSQDLDLGSTSPVLLGGGVVAQGGKDGLIRLVGMQGTRTGGEMQTVETPSRGMMFSSPAVWRERGVTWLFAADGGGTAAWVFSNGRLEAAWSHATGGTTPVVAGGLLYVYEPRGAVHVYDARSGRELAKLECGGGHWNSPIVVDGRVALPEGNANSRSGSGVLNVWSLE